MHNSLLNYAAQKTGFINLIYSFSFSQIQGSAKPITAQSILQFWDFSGQYKTYVAAGKVHRRKTAVFHYLGL